MEVRKQVDVALLDVQLMASDFVNIVQAPFL